jgi:hypothetical protein
MMPKIGMRYEDVSKRCKRILRSPGDVNYKRNLLGSLANQCRLAEGEKAIIELERDLSLTKKSSQSFSGAGPKQTGIGPGRKLGDGRWRYEAGKWNRID